MSTLLAPTCCCAACCGRRDKAKHQLGRQPPVQCQCMLSRHPCSIHLPSLPLASPPPSCFSAALASGDIDGAAKLIANASARAIATAATLAPVQGLTQQLAQASVLAVTKYGASATTVASALSQVRSGRW